MKRFVFVLSLILVFTMLCSCTDKYDIVFEMVEEESSAQSSETESIDKTEIEFTAEIPSEEFLSSTKNYHSFTDKGENYVSVLYKTNHTVSKVELFKIRLYYPNRYVKDEVVYKLDTLSPDKHLIASTLIVGTTPQMAISFSDEDGNIYSYSINRDKDGNIVLEETNFVVLPIID